MLVLVLDVLIRQSSDRVNISKDVIVRILNEYNNFAELEKQGSNAIQAYLKKKNGKKLEGSDVKNVFKYRLDSGDRILYTYGKYLSYIRDEDKDSLVLLGYSKHDDQGFIAKNTDFSGNHFYKRNEEILRDINDLKVVGEEEFSVEELIDIVEIISADYINGHSLCVVPDEDLGKIEIEDFDKYLSEEQDDCLKDFGFKPRPTLVMGGAGTGKTLVAVHMLRNYALNNNGHAAYFTQSTELLEKSRALYNTIAIEDTDATIDFYNINDLCMDALGIGKKNFVEYRQFVSFFNDNKEICKKSKKIKIDSLDLWTEIRGVLKGSMDCPCGRKMGRQWSRLDALNQQNFEYVDYLVNAGYLKRLDYDKKRFYLDGEILTLSEKYKRDYELDNGKRDVLDSIFKYFQSFDGSINMLSKEEYILLSDESSNVELESRSVVWEICRDYCNWLNINGLYDDNDLAREFIKRGIKEKYELIVVDEIQDYSEMQIFLLYSLSNNGVKIVFAGDEHQNVNPTLFREKRLKALIREGKAELKTVYFKKNYRCPQGVVDIGNRLAEDRRKMIGSKSAETEQPSESLRESMPPYRVSFTEENLVKLCKEIDKYPGAVMLVPSENARQYVNHLLAKKGFDVTSTHSVFTIPEIKGMEYTYVVCFNLIGDNELAWDKIYKGDAKNTTKYRYYYNLLNVGITRSQSHLCLIDSVVNQRLEQILKLKLVDYIDADELEFSALDTSKNEWLRMAQEYERQGQYETAIEYYREGCAEDKNIYRCEMKSAELSREFDIAGKYALLINDYERAYSNAKEITEAEGLNDLCELLNNCRDGFLGKVVGVYGSVDDLITEVFVGFTEHEIDIVREGAITIIGNNIKHIISN